MIDLEYEMTYRLEVTGPLVSTDGSSADPRRQFWVMQSATLEGSRVHAKTPLPGIDWFSPYGDGFGRPHVRLPFQTDDGAVLLMEYRGIVQATEPFTAAVRDNGSTEWHEQYMRMAMTFDTTSDKYRWLTQHLFMARGRLLGAKLLEYEIYRVR
jgi:hypothetical protein